MTRPEPHYQWKRLSPWAIGTRVVRSLPSLVPALIGVVFLGRSAGPAAYGAFVVLVAAGVGLVPWLMTRYRVTEAQLEVHTGLVRRETKTARRDRIRSVDSEAGPIERILGLRILKIGTGVGGERAAIRLDPLRADVADALARELLRRSPAAMQSGPANTAPATAASAPAEAAPVEEELARMRPAWIRYGPFSLTGLAAVAAAAGVGVRLANDLHLTDVGSRVAERWGEGVWSRGPAVVVPAAVIAVLVIAGVVSMLAYVFAFWGFRLWRRPDGTLHTTRGLLSTSSVTVERRRVRGVRVHEPILMRIPKGAKVHGLASGAARHPILLPPAPRTEALRVADAALGRTHTVDAPLESHGASAHRRRYTRAALSALAPLVTGAAIAEFLATGRWALAAVVIALGCAAAMVVVAPVRYRNLGHAVRGDALVIGECTIARSRAVLEFDGIAGWVTKESFFQRRSGVVTLIAATAVGHRHYPIADLTPNAAAELAAAVLPDIVGPVRTSPVNCEATGGTS